MERTGETVLRSAAFVTRHIGVRAIKNLAKAMKPPAVSMQSVIETVHVVALRFAIMWNPEPAEEPTEFVGVGLIAR